MFQAQRNRLQQRFSDWLEKRLPLQPSREARPQQDLYRTDMAGHATAGCCNYDSASSH